MVDPSVNKCSGNGANDLYCHITTRVLGGNLIATRAQDRGRHSRIVMPTRDVACGVDHDHQRRRDRERRRLGLCKHIEPNSEHEHEGAKKLADEFGGEACLGGWLAAVPLLWPHDEEDAHGKRSRRKLDESVKSTPPETHS